MAHIVEGAVGAAGDAFDLLHGLRHNVGEGFVEGINALAALEIDVGVLGRAALMGMFRVHGVLAEFVHFLPVHHFADIFVVDDFDFLDFMRGAEAVEEMADGHAGLDGSQMRHKGEVHAFLHGAGADEGEARLAGGHDVLMISENAQGVGGQRACRNMENRGEQFARDFVHVGDHEQQALRGRKGAGHGARDQRTVHGARCAGFGLEFPNGDGLAQQVLFACGGPVVSQFAHDGRRRDRIDARDVAQRIGNMGRRGVAVHGFHFLSHEDSLPPSGGLLLSRSSSRKNGQDSVQPRGSGNRTAQYGIFSGKGH